MTKDEALNLAMDWYGSGNQDPDEFERLILSIVAQREQDGECKHCTDGCPACDARKLPEQEPVAIYRAGQAKGEVYHVQFFKKMAADEVLLYAKPQDLQLLTDDEILLISVECSASHQHIDIQFARAIESKLKEKNS